MAAKNDTITFWLIRCGETSWSAVGRLRGKTDLPLSNSGRSEILAADTRLTKGSISTIYHPSDESATETAYMLTNITGGKTKSIEQLADADLGLLEGMTEQAFAERYPKRFKSWREDPLTLSPPDGEELFEAQIRLFTAVAKILGKGRPGEIGFVLHPLALGMLRCWLTDRPTSDLWSMIKDRSRIERYILMPTMLEGLIEAASIAGSRD